MLTADEVWQPVVTDGRAITGEYRGLASAVRAALSEPSTSDRTQPITLLEAAVICPPFFQDHARYRVIHAAGCSATSSARRYDAALYGAYNRRSQSWVVKNFYYKSVALHQLNVDAGFLLERNPLAYLRYFMYIVRSEDGPFRLVDDPREKWPFGPQTVLKRTTSPGLPADSISRIHSPRFDGIDYLGRLRYVVCLLHLGHLFSAQIAIDTVGRVEMLSDKQMFEVPDLKEKRDDSR